MVASITYAVAVRLCPQTKCERELISMKKQTPMERAKRLYMADRCNGAVQPMTDHEVIAVRVNAFVDGVNWQKRQARRSAGKSAAKGNDNG